MNSLADYFERNGCVRYPDLARREKEGQKYKKGYEVRLKAQSRAELLHIRRLLRALRLRAGKPYAKQGNWVQPVYGRESVERFLEMVRSESRG